MPRYDDRYGGTRLYVGHLSSRTRSRDLEDLFRRYGRVRSVDMKHDFAFVEFSDPRDADDARYSLDGRDLSGSRIVVEFAKGGPRGRGSSREYVGRGPPPGSGRCFNCGIDGHWARDCKAGDWKNKCYRCGERGHIERSCQNSPKSLRRGRSYSRTPSPRRGRSRSRSHSRSRSPPRRRERSIEPEEMSRSPVYSRSPSPSKGRNHSPYPEGSRSPSPLSKGRNRNSLSPGGSRSPPPSKGRERSRTRSPLPSKGRRRSPSPTGSRRSHQEEHNGSNYGESPRRRSPVSQGQESTKTNGRSPSPQRDDDDDDERASQGGSQSPQN